MSTARTQSISNLLKNVNICESGVSFQGKGLKLDDAPSCSEIVAAICKCSKLEYLNLEGNTLGVEASTEIAKALQSKPELKRALWKDMFTGRMKEEIPKALINLGSGLTLAGAKLIELDLSDNAFGPIGVDGLAGLLSSQTCYQLQILKLNNNGLGITGCKILAKALLQCHKNSLENGRPVPLKTFIAGRNRLENEGATALSDVFKALGTLEEVSLPQNGIYADGIKALFQSFVKNPNLKVINLNDNTVTEVGADIISKALPHIQKLEVLNLGDCLLRTEGATVLAAALLEKHRNLQELYLNDNEIKSSGGLAVAKAMKNKNKLKHLNLNGNQFGTKGCELLKKELTISNRVSSLDSLSEDDDECDDKSDSGNENENGSDEDSHISESNLTSPQLKNSSKDVRNDCTFNFSLKEQDIKSINTFLNSPTEDNFQCIDKEVILSFIQWKEESSTDFYIDTLIPMIMKISSLNSCVNVKYKTVSSDISYDLYKKLFTWANKNNKISVVNNMLIVYLGLIKSEDKNFKVNWNVASCLLVLQNAISEGIVPESTEQILKCCQKRTPSCTAQKINIS